MPWKIRSTTIVQSTVNICPWIPSEWFSIITAGQSLPDACNMSWRISSARPSFPNDRIALSIFLDFRSSLPNCGWNHTNWLSMMKVIRLPSYRRRNSFFPGRKFQYGLRISCRTGVCWERFRSRTVTVRDTDSSVVSAVTSKIHVITNRIRQTLRLKAAYPGAKTVSHFH